MEQKRKLCRKRGQIMSIVNQLPVRKRISCLSVRSSVHPSVIRSVPRCETQKARAPRQSRDYRVYVHSRNIPRTLGSSSLLPLTPPSHCRSRTTTATAATTFSDERDTRRYVFSAAHVLIRRLGHVGRHVGPREDVLHRHDHQLRRTPSDDVCAS